MHRLCGLAQGQGPHREPREASTAVNLGAEGRKAVVHCGSRRSSKVLSQRGERQTDHGTWVGCKARGPH